MIQSAVAIIAYMVILCKFGHFMFHFQFIFRKKLIFSTILFELFDFINFIF